MVKKLLKFQFHNNGWQHLNEETKVKQISKFCLCEVTCLQLC